MKRSILIFAFTLCCVMQMMAQLNGSGYYRLRNAGTGRYISFTNNKLDYTTIIATAGNGARHMFSYGSIADDYGVPAALSCATAYLQTDIHMVDGTDSPSTILYLDKYSTSSSNYNYDIKAQSTSLIKLTTGSYSTSNITATFENIYATIKPQGSTGKYYAYITLKGTGKYLILSKTISLGDQYLYDDGETFNITKSYSSSNSNHQWYIEPVTSVEINPVVAHDGKYYTTYYTAFPYTIGGNIENAYVVSGVDASSSTISLASISGTSVPACTPVVLECSSQSGNYITPTGTPTVVASGTNPTTSYSGTNYLEGTFFCNTDGKMYFDKYTGSTVGTQGTTTTNGGSFDATNVTNNVQSTMRVLAAVGNRIGFFKFGGEYMGANKAWLQLPSAMASTAARIPNAFSISFDGVADLPEEDKVVSEDGGFPDAIDGVQIDGRQGVAYDLQGRRVSPENLTKGIYIINGRKVSIQ